MFQAATLADLPTFRIGHIQDEQDGTGCTVVIAPEGATCGVDVRGGGPATRETDLLRPENMIEAVHAVVLSGGSAFGLEASCGVMDALAKRGIGFPVGEMRVPIVVGACLFDLLIGKPAYPGKAMGYAATETAFTTESATLAQGNVGAGCGATVGKIAQPWRATKSGFGWTCLRAGDVIVAALVAVNALGCVCDENGTWIAGVRDDENHVIDPLTAFSLDAAAATEQAQNASQSTPDQAKPCENTTLGVVLTNAQLTKAQATKVSSTVHDAYARAIKPVHTSNDADTIFTLASGNMQVPADLVAVLATETMQQAIMSAVRHAKSAFGLPAACDLYTHRLSTEDEQS